MKKNFLSRIVLSVIVTVGLTWNCTPEEIEFLTNPPVTNDDNSNAKPARAPEFIAGDYFVAPNGDDKNPGTREKPWKTWTKAFKEAVAGDTVYFRGGVYYSTSDNGGERGFKSGTLEAPICFFNYPGETPILDCSNHDISATAPLYNKGVAISAREYIHFKGLHIRNVFQSSNGLTAKFVQGIDAYRVGYITFENMSMNNVMGSGFDVSAYYGTIRYINCDAFNLCDTYSAGVHPAPETPGQNGVGFYFNNSTSTPNSEQSKVYYIGCRAWEFSDNGFDGNSNGYIEWNNCWAFDGGQLYGEGCGWKYCSSFNNAISDLPIARLLKNCIGAVNGGYAFSPNNQGRENMRVLCYNNTAYYNGYKKHAGGINMGFGFRIMRTKSINPPKGELYANNLAYDNEVADFIAYRGQLIKEQNNSWNLPLTVTDDDFVSLDWTEMKRPRKEDGSLPDIDFMKLKNESRLIDKGVDVGLSYLGKAPDLGAFEVR